MSYTIDLQVTYDPIKLDLQEYVDLALSTINRENNSLDGICDQLDNLVALFEKERVDEDVTPTEEVTVLLHLLLTIKGQFDAVVDMHESDYWPDALTYASSASFLDLASVLLTVS